MALPESMQWTKLIARFPGDICTTHVASVPRIKRKVKSKWAWSTFPYSSWSLWVGESSLWLLKLKKCEINVPNFRCLENKRKIMQFLWISCSNKKKEKEVRLHQDTTVDILVTLIFHDQCFQLLSIPRCRGHPKILLWMVYNTAPAPVLSIGSLVFRAQKLIHGDIYIYE